MATIRELKKQLKEASADVYDLDKRKRSASFKQLSKYSQNLFNEDYKEAVSKQFDIIEQIVDLIADKKVSEEEAMQAVNIATKK